jgi:pantothenate kinase
MLDVTEDILVERLLERWAGFDYDEAAIVTKMEGNDLPNVRLVLANSRPADIMIRSPETPA